MVHPLNDCKFFTYHCPLPPSFTSMCNGSVCCVSDVKFSSIWDYRNSTYHVYWPHSPCLWCYLLPFQLFDRYSGFLFLYFSLTLLVMFPVCFTSLLMHSSGHSTCPVHVSVYIIIVLKLSDGFLHLPFSNVELLYFYNSLMS